MVIVNIKGGLGNQMFQFAFIAGAINTGKTIKFNISTYSQYQIHTGFELNRVFNNIPLQVACTRDLFYFVKRGLLKQKY